jgi:hypothetical protein
MQLSVPYLLCHPSPLTTGTGLGGENLSLSVDYNEKSSFHSSGYEKIVTNKTYNGGVVRQYENFSFSRVFHAGHTGTSLPYA